MKRSNFLRFTTGGLVTTALAAPALAQTPPQVNWRLQSSYPRSLETLYGACDFFSRAVADASDGRFRVQVFAAGEIIPPLQIVDGVQQGTVEMGHTGSYFYMGKDPAFAFGTGIPFGLNSRQVNAWFYQGGGIDLLNEFFATFNMFHLPAGNTGTQMGGWFRKEVRSVADLQGLKMRIGGLAGTALQRLGLVPQQLAAGDTYTALERGTLDAVEWVGPADDEKLGFARIAPYYYYPSFWEGNSALSFFINLDKWRALPERWQNVVKTAAMAAATDMQAKYDVLNPPALRRLVAGGTQLRSFPPDVLQASYKAARDLYIELSDKHPNFKRLHDHLVAFRGQSLPWWQISDFSYDALMAQASRAELVAAMRLCSFAVATPLGPLRRIGLATPQGILDATAARAAFLERRLPVTAAQRIAAAEVPPDMLAFLGTGPLAMEWLAEAAEAVLGAGIAATADGQTLLHEPDAITLLAPVPRPPGIACFVTWKAHIENAAAKGFALKWPEPGSEIRPYYKANPDAVAGPDTPLRLPGYAATLDVECEMAAIVGLGGKDLTTDEAERAIAGYCIFNDVSVRDIQKREMEFGLGPTKGKDQDAGNILGPWLVTADEVGNPRGLRMSLHVNDEEWSAYDTAKMEWSFAELLAYLSRGQTVLPGQVVTSGSYPGGSAMDLGRSLKPGDLVELRIDRLGSLLNRIALA